MVVHDLEQLCSQHGAEACVVIVASDGVWDHWEFSDAMAALCRTESVPADAPLIDRQRVLEFFEETRAKGEEAFGDGADNLTGIVALFPRPAPQTDGAPRIQPPRVPLAPPVHEERQPGSDLDADDDEMST